MTTNKTVASTHNPLATNIDEELLRLLAKQAKQVPFAVFFPIILIANFAANYISPWWWGTWLLSVFSILTVRWLVLKRLPLMTNLSINRRIKIAITLSAINGIIVGASAIFFPYFSVLEQALQTIILLTICAGAIATTTGHLLIFLAYAIPALIPLTLMWFYTGMESGNRGIEYVAACLSLIYGLVLVALAKDSNRLFRESFSIRLEQAKLNDMLQTALSETVAANQSKARFLASASHDLRQPVHTLSLFSAALTMEPLNQRGHEITQHMNAAIEALAKQLDDLLDISKLDANVVQPMLSAVSFRSLLARLGEELKPLAEAKGLYYLWDCHSDFFVMSDPLLLERVLRNLIDNAIKYTNNGGVHIHVHSEENYVLVRISDTGCGIAPSEKERIFDEFYQVSNPERDRTMGLGLGLAIVKRLTKLLELELDITSTVDKGTSFYLKIPVAAVSQQDSFQQQSADLSSFGLHVLVVDDEVSVGAGMKLLLENLGCTVSVTTGSDLAETSAKAHKPDIVLADFRLCGDDNGIRTIERLRRHYPNLPALLISGDTAPDRLREAQLAQIKLLHKPVKFETLKQTIIDICQLKQEEVLS